MVFNALNTSHIVRKGKIMAIYYDEVVSGKGVSLNIGNGDSAYSTIVRNSAALRVADGGYVEKTTVYNNAVLSNAGIASLTFLSGGTMTLSNGGSAEVVSVLRNARMTVHSGAVATGIYVSSGNVNATVYGGDAVTRIEGTNELGSFYLSNGVASNFLLNTNGQLTVLNGGSALDTVIKANAALTVSNGGVATGIVQSRGGKLNTTIRGGDTKTYVAGSNDSGTFLLSDGVASGFILYENTAQYVSNGGVALRTQVSSSWAHQFVYSGGTASATQVFRQGSMTVYDGGVARDTLVYSGGSMMPIGGEVFGATIYGELLVTSGNTGEEESGGSATLSDISIMSDGIMKVTQNADFGGTITLNGSARLTSSMTILDGASLVWDVTGRDGSSAAIISDWTKVVAAVGATYSVSISVGTTPECGFYKLADNAATFAKTITVNSGTTELGTLSVGENFLEDGLRYSLAVDDANTLLFTIADTTPPTLDGDPEAEVIGYSATITWNPAIDASGIKNYILRVDGADLVTAGTSYTLTDLALGDHTCQLQAVDIYDNKSTWSSVQGFSIVDITPKNVVLSATGATWDASPNVTGYVAELSTDGFENAIRFAVNRPGIDFYNPAVGNYGFKVRADVDTVYSAVAEATVDGAETGAVEFVSDADGITDAFFAQSDEVWHAGYFACHVGTEGWKGGTGESISLSGRNRIANVFRGSEDASILFLSDSGNGDALELDDIFTALPDGESDPIARFSRIGEVRAGAGDDIIDLTSTKFSADEMILRGGDGDDVIWSGDGDNLLFGDAGNDRLAGGADDDVLCGGIGDDRMHGGGGNDIFTFVGNWGKDTVRQTADGGVTLWFGDLAAEEVTISTSMGNTVISHGDDTVTVTGREANELELRFGAAGYEDLYDELAAQGAFADYSSSRIFEKQDSIAVIASLT